MSHLTPTARTIAVALVVVAAASVMSGCMNKAPQLTPEQIQAGVIAAQHPVSQAEATKRGCECHLQK